MSEIVAKYLEEHKQKEELKEKNLRNEKLISLGLVERVDLEYSPDGKQHYPYIYWDKEQDNYYQEIKIAPEVTDEEYHQILKCAESEESAQYNDDHIDNGAEKTLNGFTIFALIVSLLAALVLIVMGLSEGENGLLVMGLTIIPCAFLLWAFIKVYVNISNNLHRINQKLK